jgi:hypothetical protein
MLLAFQHEHHVVLGKKHSPLKGWDRLRYWTKVMPLMESKSASLLPRK